MPPITESTLAMAVAVVGVVATIIWYALAWYGLRTLRDIRDTVENEPT